MNVEAKFDRNGTDVKQGGRRNPAMAVDVPETRVAGKHRGAIVGANSGKAVARRRHADLDDLAPGTHASIEPRRTEPEPILRDDASGGADGDRPGH